MTDRILELERKGQDDQSPVAVLPGGGSLMMTPKLGGSYWAYRVILSGRQAIVGFPKFGTIGIGFAEEEDWNTNLPYRCGTEEIYDHIAHNKGDDTISREDCLEAIRLIQQAVREDRAEVQG